MKQIKWKRLPHAKDLPLPSPATDQAAGFDIRVAVDPKNTRHNTDFIMIYPEERRAVPTGFCVEIPDGYEIEVCPRSGLAIKSGVTVINSPGTIDSDYRGEVKVLLINHSSDKLAIHHGDRIAQLKIRKVINPEFEFVEVDEMSDTERGAGGFGSTGKD